MQILQCFALPPETRIAIILPEPAVLHFIEIPPLDMTVNKKDITAGSLGASLYMIRSIIDLPARPATAGRLGEIGLYSVRPIAGSDIGNQLNRCGRSFRID
jgi:hypothetical protein